MAPYRVSRIGEMLARLGSRVKARTVERPWFRWVVWATVGLILYSVAMAAIVGVGALVRRRPVDEPMDLLTGQDMWRLYGRYEWQLQAVMSAVFVALGLTCVVWLARWWRRHDRGCAEGGDVARPSS